MSIIGIELGNSFCHIAIGNDDGRITTLEENKIVGYQSIPMLLTYTDDGYVIGREARYKYLQSNHFNGVRIMNPNWGDYVNVSSTHKIFDPTSVVVAKKQ